MTPEKTLAPQDAVTLEQATALSTAIQTIPEVAQLHRGRFGEVSLLFAQHRVPGIRLNQHNVEIHVTLFDTTSNIPAVSEAIQQVTRQHFAHLPQVRSIEVTVHDIVSPHEVEAPTHTLRSAD